MEKVVEFLKVKGFKYVELVDGLGYAFETETFNCIARITGPFEYRVEGRSKLDFSDWFSCSGLPSQDYVIDKTKEHAIKEGAK